MSAYQNDVIPGTLKITNLPECQCFTSFEDFIKALPNYLGVELPKNFTNVSVGNVQPSEADRDTVWFRMSPSGAFIGIFVYYRGTWISVFPAPNQLIRVVGDSRTPPTGYKVVAVGDAGITDPTTLTAIQTGWVRDSTNTYYIVFDTVFIGL